MVQAVRDHEPMRVVAARFDVSVGTVAFWVQRCVGRRLDRCAFEDRKAGPRTPWNRSSLEQERRVLATRKRLKEQSVLGEFGAPAIHHAMRARTTAVLPSVATIGRILQRHGATDAGARVRRPAPPKGWYLPPIAAGQAELDSFDAIEDLKFEHGPLFSVLTATSLQGNDVDAWPKPAIGAQQVVDCLLERWRRIGLPHYAQFDNDTIFQGPHQYPDTIGRVSRLCLSLGVIPVFVPPREPGFQNAIEGFNGLWQAKVWQRFQYADLATLRAQSQRYVRAHHQRTAKRREAAPARYPFPTDWRLDFKRAPSGTLVYLRRTDSKGRVQLMGHRFDVNSGWLHRLARCEVRLDQRYVVCFALRRREPTDQPLLIKLPYHRPNKPFKSQP
jgi:hypothetical protein